MDCSTFSLDLHVLSAPPALILSRDQTLIEKCRVIESPQLYSEILTSSSLLHPTRLSKICAAEPRHHRNDAADSRPRNLLAACSHYNRARGSKLKVLKKNQTGRPYSAPNGGPFGVLLPFLTRGSRLLYHPTRSSCKPARNKPSDSGDSIRIPNGWAGRKR